MIEMIKIDSNHINAVGFDDDLNILQIQYSDRGTYAYNNVKLLIFAELLQANSKNEFIKENIIGRYGCFRIG